MLNFFLLATILTAAAVATVAVPLMRKGASPGAPRAALLAGIGIAAGAALLYATLSNWSWHAPQAGAGPHSEIARLARQQERSPDDLEGWIKLARAYVASQQFQLAARAYQRADRLAAGRNVEALTGLAEALALGNDAELDGRAGRLLEQALALDPRSAKALYYSALAALRRGDLSMARSRFQTLLDLDPPKNIQPILSRQIAMIDAQLASGPMPVPEKGRTETIRVNVVLTPQLRPGIRSDTPMFVFVRIPAQPGPPLAARRLWSRFPQSVELTPADSMLAGHSFQAGQEVEVVARISVSGQPTGAKGDPVGQIRYRVGQAGTQDLVIDHLMP